MQTHRFAVDVPREMRRRLRLLRDARQRGGLADLVLLPRTPDDRTGRRQVWKERKKDRGEQLSRTAAGSRERQQQKYCFGTIDKQMTQTHTPKQYKSLFLPTEPRALMQIRTPPYALRCVSGLILGRALNLSLSESSSVSEGP